MSEKKNEKYGLLVLVIALFIWGYLNEKEHNSEKALEMVFELQDNLDALYLKIEEADMYIGNLAEDNKTYYELDEEFFSEIQILCNNNASPEDKTKATEIISNYLLDLESYSLTLSEYDAPYIGDSIISDSYRLSEDIESFLYGQ